MAQYTEQNNLSKLCPTLGDAMHYSPLGSSVHEFLQARILEWVALPPNPEIKLTSLMSPPLAVRFFTTSATWEAPTPLLSLD